MAMASSMPSNGPQWVNFVHHPSAMDNRQQMIKPVVGQLHHHHQQQPQQHQRRPSSHSLSVQNHPSKSVSSPTSSAPISNTANQLNQLSTQSSPANQVQINSLSSKGNSMASK